jgi:transmembrane sensor
MTSASSPRETEIHRLAEACAWRTALAEARLDTSPAFEAWLYAAPDNLRAWDLVNGPWTAVGDAATSPEGLALRQQVLYRARRQGRRRWRGFPGPTAAASGAAAVAATVLLGLWASGMLWGGQAYQTGFGERRTVTLADGSKVTLDSSTKVLVRYSKDARKLDLVSGQARFDVAHDVSRPFSVHARDETVVATGTVFNIDLLDQRVRVTLLEGHVTILADAAPHAPRTAPSSHRSPPSQADPTPAVELKAGQALVGQPSAAAKVMSVSLQQTVAWESGQLMFDDEPLSDVALRINRYTTQKVVVDPSVATLRLSGVFNTGDASTFVDTVTHYLPIKSREESNGTIVLMRSK